MADYPILAVVGHPNKGKSSVVSALTQNDQVHISPLSGTTRVAQHFSLKLDGETVFELVDTPGFQRAAKCLAWLRVEELPADQRPARVAEFVEQFRSSGQFFDEVELLKPIVAGAGIIYVVDGSLPYSPEYETEMEILRWTGRPRLALINPIGGDAYVAQWQQALNQYFSLVKQFDPLHASFDQHLQLLRSFGELDSRPGRIFDQAIEQLEQYRRQKLEQAARILVENLYRLLTYQQSSSRLEQAAREQLPELLPAEISRFNQHLNRLERDGQQQLEALFLYHRLESDLARLEVRQSELMDESQWTLWGLEKKQLVLVSAAAGATLGLLADAGLGGSSLFAGAIGGGVLGGVSGWLGLDWFKQQLPAWLQFSAEQHLLGPVKDPNFAFVILGRALSHARAMLARSHADRERLTIHQAGDHFMQSLEMKVQIRLLKQCKQLVRQGPQGQAAEQLRAWIYQQLTA